jgi:hypothetical protein
MNSDLGLDYKQDPFYKSHRNQITWQVGLPITIALLIVIGMATILIIGTSSGTAYRDLTYWASISIIILLIPCMIGCVFLMGILFGSIFGLSKGLSILPVYLKIGNNYISQLFTMISNYADKSINPIIEVKIRYAVIKSIFHPKSRIKTIGAQDQYGPD